MTDTEFRQALARIEELERSNQTLKGLVEAAGKDNAEMARMVARHRGAIDDWASKADKLQARAVELEEEKQMLEKQIEGYCLGLEAYRCNPQFQGLIRADAVIMELKRIIGRDYAPIQRDKAIKAQLTEHLREKRFEADVVPVPAQVRRRGGLGPVVIAAELVANQWEMGNVPSEASLDTLCKTMKMYSMLVKALDAGRCSACGQVICQCPETVRQCVGCGLSSSDEPSVLHPRPDGQARCNDCAKKQCSEPA